MSDCVTGSEATPKTYYSIEAPGVLWSNARYNVAINLFEAAEPCQLDVILSGGAFKLEKRVEVQPVSTKLLSFEIPDLSTDNEYYLEVKSLKGIAIKEKIKLSIKPYKPLIYIQCDKQAYKRGDNVDFRVLLLEPQSLRPAKLENSLIVLIKHGNNVVSEQKNIQTENGLYASQWQIPKLAAHGIYSFEVLLNNTSLKAKNFEIIDFTPPKFEIKILTDKRVFYDQRQLNIGVEAKYADGTPVNGNCKMEVECVAGFFSGVYIEKSIPIFGRVESTIIDLIEDLKIDKSFMEMTCFTDASVMVKVTIFDESTGNEEILRDLITVEKKKSVLEKNAEKSTISENSSEAEKSEDDENKKAIKIIPPRESATIGETLNFTIQLNKPTDHCFYCITARGTIIKSELINVKDYRVPIACALDTTFQFVPRAFILAYFICDGMLYFDEEGFNLAKEFENKLTITTTVAPNPGGIIPIEIQTAPNAFIGVMGVDVKSMLLNAKNDLEAQEIFRDLFYIRSQIVDVAGSGRYPGIASGLYSLTNATIDDFEIDASNNCSFIYDPEHTEFVNLVPRIDVNMYKKDIQLIMQEREQVFGNLLFVNKKANQNGYLKLEVALPNNPTTWLLNAFALSTEKGFAMTKEPLKIEMPSSSTAPSETIDAVSTSPTIAKSKVTEFVVDNYNDGLYSTQFSIDISNDVAPVEVTFSITENLFGPTIAKLDDHAGIMYCTGHLHMTTVIPNVNVLEYLDHLDQLDSEFALSIKNRFPEAIERELAERREGDGSFSWFGSDPTGSPHVTSLVLQAFQRVSKYVEVDPVIIERGLAYLASRQMESGEIAKENNPYEYPFEKNNSVGLTAMVLLAFLQNEKVKNKYTDFIEKSFEYIIANIESTNCIYDLALSFYAMQLAKHSYAATLKERLFKIAKSDSIKNYIWWSYNTVPDIDVDFRPPVSELEVTSYILLGLLETESIEALLPIIKWMLPTGDFANESMDRAVALDAILKMAAKSGAALAFMEVDFTAFCTEGTFIGKIVLTPENSSRILTQVLPLNTEKLELTTKNKGTFFGNITYRYREL